MASDDTNSAGVIRPHELYTLQAFCQRLGVRDATLRAARRAGLRVCYVHRHGFIYGRDWIDYVLSSQDMRDAESVAEADSSIASLAIGD